MRFLYCSCALVIALAGGPAAFAAASEPAHDAPLLDRPLQAAPAAAQAQPSAPASEPTAYTIFFRGTPIGREDVSVQSDASGTTVVTEGRVAGPADLLIRRAEFKYGADGSPQSFLLLADASGAQVDLQTTVKNGTAVTEGSQAGKPVNFAHPISQGAVLHANGIFGSYVALARRLSGMKPGGELRLYVVPQAEITVRIRAVADEQMQLGADFLSVRRYELAFVNPGGELAAQLTTDREGRLVGVTVPSQAITVVRADLAASTARTQVHSNPGDEPVTIPAVGFNLAGTLTRPKTAAGRLPVVILLNGSGADDRDGYALGLPTLGQLAGALADAGFLVVRYDKRGYGQSGGRAESATIQDYAEDVRSVMRWLARRPDVDEKRIGLIGHADGAWVALLAAAREKKFAAVVSLAGPASTGAELVLEQQRRALDRMQLTPAERERRVALQKQIQTAVLTGRGWEAVPPDIRKQADTPWFQSLLAFTPAKVLEDVRQPLLFIHGELDSQVPVAHADRLAALAREESDSGSIEVVIVRGVNHLLVPATTGEISEYATLTERTVSPDVTSAIGGWLTRTFAAVR